MTGKKSVYYTTYLLLFIIVLSFFAHPVFESCNTIDLFHLDKEIRFSFFGEERVLFIRDIYPFMDFPDEDIYGNPLKLNLQIWMHKTGQKVIALCFSLLAVNLLKAFNAAAYLMSRDVPKRSDRTILGFLYVFVCLFAYDLFDYVMLYSQTPFEFELLLFAGGILYVYFNRE